MNRSRYFNRLRFKEFSLGLILTLFTFVASAEPTGSFRYPTDNKSFDGNLLISGSVQDTEALGSIFVRFNNNSATQILVCSACDTQDSNGDGIFRRSFTDAGINPRDYNLSIGSHTAQLIHQGTGAEQVLDQVQFSWEPPEITGINVNRVFGEFTISWSALTGYRRYNLYIASEANISPGNIDSLPDNMTYRALTGTTQRIQGVNDELGLFGIVTGTDTSGESAYSQVFRIEALDNQDPTTGPDAFTLSEDTSTSGNVLTNDADPEGEALTASLVNNPTNGTVELSSNGNFTYTPNTNFNGTDQFNYTANDPRGGTQLGTVTLTVTSVNDAPVANGDSYTTTEDVPIAVTAAAGLLINDSDVDGDVLTVSLVSGPQNGSLSLNSDGSFNYLSVSEFSGSDTFTYQVTDTAGASDTAVVTIEITGINDPPVANNDNFLTSEDVTLSVNASGGVLVNDSDADALFGNITDELTVTLVTGVNNGTLTLGSDGSFQYTPADNFFGNDSFVYLVTDSAGSTDSATAFIEIASVNDAPLAQSDSYQVDEDNVLNVDSNNGLTANDSDVESASSQLTVSITTPPLNGSVELGNSGAFVYTPNANFFGTDTLTYQISDPQGATASAQANFVVNSINDAPLANDDVYQINEDETLQVSEVTIGLLANDSDPDFSEQDKFTQLTVAVLAAPEIGELNLQPNGTFTYSPASNFFGSVIFSYQVTDPEGLTASASVTINIADAPDLPIAVDDSYLLDEDSTLLIAASEGVLVNDSDPSNSGITASILTETASGTLLFNSDGSFDYQPNENFNGPDSFVYQITNGANLTATATVTLNVTPINDAPVGVNDVLVINESDTITFNPLENDTDAEDDPLRILSASAEIGQLNFTENTITYTAIQNSTTDVISYTLADPSGAESSAIVNVNINNVQEAPIAADDIAETNEDTAVVIFPLENDSDPDGDNLTASIQSVSNGTATLASDTSISFTPDANFNGTATISYFASDPAGNMDGGTITINVLPVNDAPVAQNDEATAPEGATIEFSPLGNDTDVDGDVLIITSAAAVSGTVNFSQSLITYTAPGTPGQDTITYTIADPAGETSSANISITVSNIQDAPVAVDDLVSTDEDTPVIITPLSNDIDEDGDALTLSIVSVSSGTATLDNNTVSYTPAANFNGTASIVYSVSDPANNSDTATITITVNPVNDAPVANNDTVTVQEDATISVSPVENDVDIDGDSLTVEIVSVSSGTAIVEGNIINYTPVANFNGTAIITYSITDPSGSSASATITVTVTAVNDAPVANNDTVSTPEDTSVTISPLLNDVDADGDELTLSVLSVSAGTAVVDGSIITYTPVANDTNTATIVYQITDPSSSFDTATITVNIGANNDTPIAVNDTATTVEDTPVQISPLLNDSDPDGDVLRVEVVSVSSGTTTINNNIISYVPATDFNGEATITYSVTDPSGSSATAIISVTVTPVNDAPVANTDNVTTNEDTTVQISPLSNDTDVDNDILTATLGTISSGTATIANNVITYTPEPNFSGVASITYTATDPSGATAPGNINITVLAVNDTPIANDDSIAIAEDSPVLITPLTNDLDPDGDSLVLAIISTSSGTATLSGDTINYSPAANFNGTATITYSITDPSGASATATITVTIAAVNDNPVAVNDNVTTSEDTSIDITPLSNDTDVENDTLSFIINSATNGTFQIISATVVRFTPTANFNGAATMQYTVTDPSGGSATGEIIINVTAVNDAPIAVTDTATVNEGETIVISPITNDSDVEGDNLTITAATTTIGSVTVNTDATTLTYTAPSGFSGVAVISYTLTDATTSVTGTVNVTVNDVNFGPTAVNDTFNVNAGETNTLNVVSNDTDPDGDNLTITAATTTLGTVTIVTDSVSSTLSYAAPADTTATATISYTISDAGGLTSSATATVNITEQPLTGDFDSDGDGMPDVSATSTGTNFNVTFGDNVDAVYYFENGELVSISANDAGVFELTIAPTSTGNKGAKTTGGVKGSNANDFELPSGTNQVFFTINGVEYSFTTTNLDQPSPNIAFNPPTTLDTSFESQISHDFFLRFPSFSGPLRLGLDNGEHYILGSDGIAEVRGTDFNFNGIWLETDGILFIDYNDSLETTQSVSVFDLDDDNSDGKALNIITKAEADAHFAATNDQFIDVFVKETREVFTLTRDNRIYIDAFVERFLSYRVDATVYPDITSAQVSTIGAVADEILAVELWDLTTAKIEKITFSDIQHGIATDIPRITNSQFSDIVADTCTFTEITTGSQSGSGLCIFNDQPFTWNIVSGVLNMDFGSDVTVQYRWIDALAVENTFSMEISEGVGSSLSQFSAHVYWLPLTNFTDSNISSILSNNYFDSGFSLTNPEARDDNRAVKDSDVFGFYFNSNGFAKNLSSSTEFTGTQITDDDRRWSVNNGLVTIDSVTNVNSGDTFAYVFDQCSNSFDANCFIWRFREWKPIALDGTRLWVWETVIQNESAFGLQNSIVYQELLPPRLQFYELNTTVPGAPNSINFNQEPVQINQFEGQAEFNTTANIDVLKVFADPEADALSVLNASPRHGSITINSDNTLAYTPESNFSGFSDIDLAVSDGINTIFTRISLQILDQNVAPVANDDTATALAGITTTLNPLSNDTDSNNDDLFITSASSDNGTVTTSTDRTQLLFTSPTNFFGPAIITYSISDERGGTATATMTVTVSQPQFSGSYDLDNSNTDDFTISVANSTYTVTFGSEVSSVYFTENGQRFILARESSGNFVFDYPAGSSLPATLTYVINGIEYTISPDNLSATTPGLVFGGTNTLVNDFGTATSYQLISRFPTHNSALATGFDNGTLYDLQSGGTGSYSSPKLSDNITWTQTAGSIQINFANPQEQLTFYSVYDLDDQVDGKDAALGVITKAEADAYFAATNTEFVDVNVATVSQLITANRKEGYYYDTIINETQRFRIDSSSHPEITSAENGVNVSTGDQPWELLNSNDFSFAPVTASDIVGTIYLSTPESAGNVFSQFSADTCTLSESSTGSNAGSGSCVLSSETFSWSIQSDNSVLVTFASSQLSVVYRWLNTDAVENTLFIKVTDSTSSVFSTLDYWFRSSTQSASNVNSLISGHYVESSDNITNPFNFDSFGQLNDSVGDGYFFNSDGLAKEIFASTDAINNQVEVSDFDHRWTINNVDVLQINALSNASSSDTFRYRYSQCTDSADQNCYIWRIITMQPLAIDGNRLWVMESELTDPDFGFFDGNISYESTGFPEIKFYEVSSSIPGDPNSISFNQEPVFTSFPTLTATVNNRAIFNLLSSIGDPENDALSIIDAQANNATVLVNGDNSISYTPDSNFAGGDILYITVTDGINVTELVTEVLVQTTNTAPVANDDSENVIGGGRSYIFDVLSNDTDAENDELTIVSISTTATGVSIGSQSKTLEYLSPGSANSIETVFYTIDDGKGGTAEGRLTILFLPNANPDAFPDTAGPVVTGSTITIFPLLNDTDLDNDPLTLTTVSSSIGSAIINSDEVSFDFTPTVSPGTFTISYGVTDGFGGGASANIDVTVVATNSAPVANDDTENAVGGHSYTFLVLNNDTDVDSDILSITNLATTASGFSIATGAAAINYTAPASVSRNESVVYTVSDGNGGTATATLTVSLVPNSNPILTSDTAGPVLSGNTITITPLANDIDPDGDSLIITNVSTTQGAATINNDQVSFNFTPSITSGTALINYDVSDGFGGTGFNTVSVTVTTANNAPVANNDSVVVTPGTLNFLSPLSNDTDADGDNLTITSSSATVGTSLISNGDKNLDYTSPSTVGTAAIDYTISDGNGGTASAVISVLINNKPVAVNDTFSISEGRSGSIFPLNNDSDPDSDPFTLSNVISPSNTTNTFIRDGSGIDYFAAEPGSFTFDYEITDSNGLTDTATISLTVTNRPVAVDDVYTVNLGQSTNLTPLDNDTDPDTPQTSLTIVGISGTSHIGTPVISSDARSINYTPPAQAALNGATSDTVRYRVQDDASSISVGTMTINFNFPPDAVDDNASGLAGQTITISPLTNDTDAGDTFVISNVSASSGSASKLSDTQIAYSNPTAGTYTVNYTITDSNGATDSANITVIVTNNPTAIDDTFTVQLAQATQLAPLDNDTDTETANSGLTLTNVTGFSHGTAVIDSGNRTFTYTSNTAAQLAGTKTDSGSYTMTDSDGGTSTANITININSAPVPQSDTLSVITDRTATVNPLSNDSDPDSDSLTITSATSTLGRTISIISSGTTLSYPAPSTAGSDTISYVISDGRGGTATGTVSVTIDANIAPTATSDTASVNEGASITLTPLSNDTDSNGDSLIILTASSSQGSVTVAADNLSLSFTPSITNGVARVNYTASDQFGGTSTSFIDVTVIPNNSPPSAVDDAFTIIPLGSVNFDPLSNDTDPDNDTLTITNAMATAGGTATIAANNVTIDYNAPSTGRSDTISYTISDGNGNQATGTINVTMNTNPVATSSSQVISTSTMATYTPSVTDNDGDSFTVSAASVPSGQGSVTFSGSSITYTSPATEGNYTISYSVQDGFGGTASSTINVTVNAAPVVTNDSYTFDTTEAITLTASGGVLANDSDANNETLLATLVSGSGPSNASTFNFRSDGSFDYTHDGMNNLTDQFTYQVTDGTHTLTGVANITIARENFVPEICGIPPLHARVNVPFSHTFTGADSGSLSSPIITNAPPWLSFSQTDSTTFAITGTPTSSDVGTTANIQVSISDGTDSTSATFSLTVQEEFGTGNLAQINLLSNSTALEAVKDIAIDNKGRIVIIGESSFDFFVARFLPNGTLDTTFDSDGVKTIDIGSTTVDSGLALDIRKDNGIILAGQSFMGGTIDWALVALNENGSIDTNFDTDGILTQSDFSGAVDERLADVIIRDDGRIYVVGTHDDSSPSIIVARYLADGTLDTSFNTNGYIIHASSAGDTTATVAMLDNDGAIFVGGYLEKSGSNFDVYLMKVLDSGLATNFDSDGEFEMSDSGNEYVYDMVFDANGNILVAGEKDTNMVVYRISITQSTGNYLVSQDTSYSDGDGDNDRFTFNGGGNEAVHKIVPDGFGNYYIVGKDGNNNTIALKLSADGIKDTSFGASGLKTISLASPPTGEQAVATLLHGQLLFADADTINSATDSIVQLYHKQIQTALSFGNSCDIIADYESALYRTSDYLEAAAFASDRSIYLAGFSPSVGTSSDKDFVVAKVDSNGDLVSDFADNGLLRFDDGGTKPFKVTDAITMGSDSLLIVGKHSTNFPGEPFLAKITSAGALDTSFSTDGLLDLAGVFNLDYAEAIYVPDTSSAARPGTNPSNAFSSAKSTVTQDKFLLGGVSDSSSGQFRIYQYNADGSLDTAFGTSGYAEYSEFYYQFSGIERLSDGSIYFVGSLPNFSSPVGITLAKFNANGSSDNLFGSGGTLTIGNSNSDEFTALDSANNGTHIFVLAEDYNSGNIVVFKFDVANDSLDSSFGSAGMVTLTDYVQASHSDIEVDSNGKIWLNLKLSTGNHASLVRLDSAGNFDASFINAGKAKMSHNIEQWTEIKGIEIDANNEAAIFGYDQTTLNSITKEDFTLALTNGAGVISNTSPQVTIDFGTGPDINDIALGHHTDLYLAGSGTNSSAYDNDMIIAKYSNTGSGNSTFGTEGQSGNPIEKYDLFSLDSRLNGISLSNSNDLYVSGRTEDLTTTNSNDLFEGKIDPETGDVFSDTWITQKRDIDNFVVGSGSSNDIISAQYLADDGSLYLAGSKNGIAIIVRYISTGPDTSFNNVAGQLFLNTKTTASHFNDITMAADGNLVAVGYSESGGVRNGLVVKFTPAGVLDEGFDSDGVLEFSATSSNESFDAVTLDPTGNIIATGYSGTDGLIVSYTTSGVLNSSFDSDGHKTINLGSSLAGEEAFVDTVRDAYGHIVLLAQVENKFAVVQIDATGTVLQNSGTYSFGVINRVRAMAIDKLGNIYVAGSVQLDDNYNWQLMVVRFPNAIGPI